MADVIAASPASPTDSSEQTPTTPQAWGSYWANELQASKKWLGKFQRQAKKVEKKYLDEERASDSTDDHKANYFWSNVQVMLAAIYGRIPKADVDRRFKDFDDDVGRVAGEILERILNSDLQREYDDTDASMRDAVQDRFVAGLGQVWCRYEVETAPIDVPGEFEEDGVTPKKAEKITSEEACVDYVRWDDFAYGPCRRWRDCPWVARAVYLDRDALTKRFGETIANAVPMNATRAGDDKADTSVQKAKVQQEARVWEIWHKRSRKAFWFAEGMQTILDMKDDPLGLKGFFPCPQPLAANTGTNKFVAKPDYAMVQDQYVGLDDVNRRIELLSSALKANFAYDKKNDALARILNNDLENQGVPVENWAAFQEAGGFSGTMSWIPMEMIANVITQLRARKTEMLGELYELLGISDIMRGVSNAQETLGAQQLKVQYGGARFGNLQTQAALFVQGVMYIRAEIICLHFQPQTLVDRSMIMRTNDAQLAPQAIQLLKQDSLMQHAIRVEPDTMSAPDWAMEKSQRTELVTAISGFLTTAAPLTQQSPESAPYLIKILQWAAAGFRGSKSLESTLDQWAQVIETKASQPTPPPQPSPLEAARAEKDHAQARKGNADAQRTELETTVGAAAIGLPMPQNAMQPPHPAGLPQ